jgi:hypothetical protein
MCSYTRNATQDSSVRQNFFLPEFVTLAPALEARSAAAPIAACRKIELRSWRANSSEMQKCSVSWAKVMKQFMGSDSKFRSFEEQSFLRFFCIAG